MNIDDLARGGPSNGVGTLKRAEESQVETLTRVNGKTRSGRLSQLPQKWEGNVTAAAEEDEGMYLPAPIGQPMGKETQMGMLRRGPPLNLGLR